MENIKGAGAAHEWSVMNIINQRMMEAWRRTGKTQVNLGRQIGVKMAEWVE